MFLRLRIPYCSPGFALFFCVFLGERVAAAATIKANSASLADVSSALRSASPGDTVLIPAGNAIWRSSLSLTKAINLIGAGTNGTIITSGFSGALTGMINVDVGQPFRISGIRFECGGVCEAITVGGKVSGFRIDRCFFRQAYSRAIYLTGLTWGVIDHCTLLDCAVAFSTIGDYGDGDSGAYQWHSPLMTPPYYQLGTTNTPIVEDCAFAYTDYSAGRGILLSDVGHGAHYVVRHCVITNVPADGDGFDVHGNNTDITTDPGGAIYGTIFFECYRNKFYPSGGFGSMGLRGGTCLVFSNDFFGSASPNVIRLQEEEAWNPNILGYIRTVWPAECQITNTFIWANTLNGTPTTNIYKYEDQYPNVSTFIHEGRDYWLRPPNSTDPLKDYKPLIYPHPLVTAQDSGAQKNPPVISISPNTLNFGSIALGSTNDLVILVKNNGAGTLAGLASISAPFSIIGNSSYSLDASACQVITVRFVPTQSGRTNQVLIFTGGGGALTIVSGMGM